MKKLIPLLLIAALVTGCKKNDGYESHGTITGFDYRKCMCCSGWFIEIEKDTLRFHVLPEGSTLNLSDTVFPVEVNLDWHIPDPQCMPDLIIVDRIEFRK
jgi:hypothetical protein